MSLSLYHGYFLHTLQKLLPSASSGDGSESVKNEGVDAYITDKTMGSFSFLGAATGGVKIHVAEKDLERAYELLSDE